MIKFIGLFALILLADSCSFAQIGTSTHEKTVEKSIANNSRSQKTDTSFQLIQTISIENTNLAVDNLQNLYVATTKGQILKYTKNGKLQFEYNNNRLGEVGKIDVHNPLNILVYYPDLSVVVILDRTMSAIKELNLLELGIIEPKGITIANDNNIWVFDQVAAILKKINQDGKPLFESRNLNQLTRTNLNPTSLQESNNLLYLSDLENGLFVFDTFGQLKQQFPIPGIKQFQIINGKVIYRKKSALMALSLDNLEEKPVILPLAYNQIEKVIIHQNRIFLKDQEEIKVYKPIVYNN